MIFFYNSDLVLSDKCLEFIILWKYSICHKIGTWRQVAQSGSMWLNVANFGSHIRATWRFYDKWSISTV